MEKKKIITRYTVIKVLIIGILIVIGFRLADIQVAHGKEYRALAQDKGIRTVEDKAPRGRILDRNGIELASDIQRYTVSIAMPQNEQDKANLNPVIERLLGLLDKNNENIIDSFNIVLKPVSDGKYTFEFNFPNNYEDETKSQEYINKAATRWKKDNGIPEDYSAEQAFYFLKDKVYAINPSSKEDNNLPFIRQIMAVRQMIRDKGYMAYKPVEIAYISRSTAFKLMEMSNELPGVDVKLEPLRNYPFGQLASLVIGGLRKIPAEDAEEYKNKGYDLSSDLIGGNGIEKYAEDYLKGQKGSTTVRVDAYGKVIGQLGVTAPIPGDNVILTIDKNLQQITENALDNVMQKIRSGDGYKKFPNATRGAAVVIDVKTGEILAMASRPGGFDPNMMAADGSISQEDMKKLYPGKDEYPGVLSERIPRPMFNYATQGAVPPGSTFKMVVGIAGLELGKLTPSEIIVDRGRYTVVPGFHGACWLWNEYGGAHGPLSLARALQVSCNYFFFEVGHRIGLDAISNYAAMFGLDNQPTGIEIAEEPGNVANVNSIKDTAVALVSRSVMADITTPDYDKKYGTFVPTDAQKNLIIQMLENNDRDSSKLQAAGISSYKIRRRILDGVMQVYIEYTKPGVALDAAIGQGNDRFTPMQVASYMATIANGGIRYQPHLVKEIVAPDNTVVKDNKPVVMDKADIKPSTFEAIKAGMSKVVDEGGTAARAFIGFPIKTAGKTGTAQASGGMDDYSWFSGYAPLDNPEIAVAVVIYEGGGQGGADVARAIYSQYFGLNK